MDDDSSDTDSLDESSFVPDDPDPYNSPAIITTSSSKRRIGPIEYALKWFQIEKYIHKVFDKLGEYSNILENKIQKIPPNRQMTFILTIGALVMLYQIPAIIREFRFELQWQRQISQRYANFYFNDDETLTINGTEFTTPFGIAKYEVVLPSYNITWRPEIRIINLFAEVNIGGEEALVKSQRDLHDCQGEGKWCLTITYPHKISNPIFVDYLMVYSGREIRHSDNNYTEALSFNRTFHIDHWEKRQP